MPLSADDGGFGRAGVDSGPATIRVGRSRRTRRLWVGHTIAAIVGLLALGSSTANADYSAGVSWLQGQQEDAQGFRVVIDEGADPNGSEPVSGHVQDVEQLAGPRVAVPWVSFEGDHSYGYVGPAHGLWGNVETPADYRVAVFSETDALYLQGVYPLGQDGTWDTGEDIVRAGRKVAQLVRVSDEEVVAVSGQPHTKIGGVEIRVFARTDVDYLQTTVPLYADGTWTTGSSIAPGTRIARLVKSDTGRTLNSSEWVRSDAYQGLVRSFWIPQDDPDYGYEGQGSIPGDYDISPGYRIEQRSWIYDDALAALAFIKDGQTARAASVLQALEAIQDDDGSLPFSVDVYLGRIAEDYRRAGAIAWVGTAAVEYERSTGSTRYRSFATELADYVLSLQVTAANGFSSEDPRYGSVLGGEGYYDAEYVYHDESVAWASTEHNIDAYFFLRDLSSQTGDTAYLAAANLIKASLLDHHWDAAEHRFNQGVSPAGPDTAEALDLGTWGGLFLDAIGQECKARQSLEFAESFKVANQQIAISADPESYNQTYTAAGPIDGYRPYLPGDLYPAAPETVWAEGTWGAILLKKRLGMDTRADVAGMDRLQSADPRGGMVQVTSGRRSLPYEFHVWPSVAGTAWATLVRGDSRLLWRRDQQRSTAAAFMPNLYFDSSERWRPIGVGPFLAEDQHEVCLAGSCTVIDSPDDLAGFDAEGAYLDVAGEGEADDYTSPDPGCNVDGLQDCDAPPTSKIYYNQLFAALPAGPYSYLDYWFLYRYNDSPGPADVFAPEDLQHEGDWESVTLAIEDETDTTFSFAAFSQHGRWYSYLREALSCDGGVTCGPASQHLDVFVAHRSHANYPRSCSGVEIPVIGGQVNCGQDGTSWPEGGGYDGARPWGGNLQSGAVEQFPTDEYQWQFWPGRWGATDVNGSGSPASPGNQPHFANPGSSSCPESEHQPAPDCGQPPERAAAATNLAARAPNRCGDWFGHDVVILVCDSRRLRSAYRRGQLDAPGRMRVATRRAQFPAAAPGLLQVTGSPLKQGRPITLRHLAPRGDLFVRVASRGRVVSARFEDAGQVIGSHESIRLKRTGEHGRRMMLLTASGERATVQRRRP